MKEETRYEIDVFKLREGQHTYEFKVSDAFFRAFEHSLVPSGEGTLRVTLDKQKRMIVATVELDVSIPLECDKTLKPFTHRVQEAQEVMYKYGEAEEELDDDLFMITEHTQRIDLSQLVYEYISMAIPMRKVHPDHQEENDEDELIYRSEETDQQQDDDDSIDPRWSKLKDLN